MKKTLLIILMALFVMAGCEKPVTDAPPAPPSPMKYGSASDTHPTFDASTLKTDLPGDLDIGGVFSASGAIEVAQQELGDGAGQTVSPNGATVLTSTAGGGESGTLGDATYIGQMKTIVMAVDGGVDWVVTISHLDTGDDSTLTFNDVDEVWIGMWTGTEWTTLRNTID
jgi:hypothetical protein